MKSRLETPDSAVAACAPRVTIWYEDLATALRANSLCEQLMKIGTLPDQFQAEFWRFDFLSDAAQARAAREMAARSDLVIVSAQRQDSFSYEVELCVNAWLQMKRKRTHALAILLEGDEFESVYSRMLLARWWHSAKQQNIAMHCDLPEWRLYSADLSQLVLPRARFQPSRGAAVNAACA